MGLESIEIARKVVGYHQLPSGSLTTAIKCPGTGAVLLLQAEAQNIRYRLDNVDPTATVGHLLLADCSIVINVGREAASTIRVIEASPGAILNITAFR